MNAEARETVEFLVKRLLLPLCGIAGLAIEEFTGTVDIPLVGAYLAMMGMAGPPTVAALRRSLDKERRDT